MNKVKQYSVTCPKCKAPLKVEVEKEIINAPIKGEYEEHVSVALDTQAHLD